MRHVVHVVAAGEIGGAERMLIDLASGSSRFRHSVALFSPNRALKHLLQDAGLDIDDRAVSGEGPLRDVWRSWGPSDVAWLTQVLRDRNACIVHLHTVGSQVVGARAARRFGCPFVRTEHSTRAYKDPSVWPMSRWSLARADAVVCISEHIRNVAQSRAGSLLERRRVRVIANGIDAGRFEACPLAEENPARGLRLLALGRLDRRKGLDRAIEALGRVQHATLDIVGDGAERARLVELAYAHHVAHRVTFHGYRADVRPHIAACDAIVSSAREEGLGIAILEAMAMARPVVALATGGVPEIVTDGVTGWLVEPGAQPVQALARALSDAARASRTELTKRGAAARIDVLRRYSLDAMRAGYEALYEEFGA